MAGVAQASNRLSSGAVLGAYWRPAVILASTLTDL
jgi:hypothetical protein